MRRLLTSLAVGIGAVAVAATGTSAAAPGVRPGASSGTITLDDGKISVPRADVGPIDLTSLPLGDRQYSSAPAKGKIDLCNPASLQPANDTTTLPWVHGSTWDLTAKVFVSGSVSWPNASFQNQVQGSTRTLRGNDLPVRGTTGTFPVTASDPAVAYRPDRGRITPSTFTLQVPATPKVVSSASCMGGDVGVSVDGVAILSGFDANGRDAAAQEVQDACAGHPNQAGYHRHSMPFCLLSKDGTSGHSSLLGYALDGFGIYGPRGDHGKVLTTASLDACHGTTDTITWSGKKVRMYHYVLTWQFPYSVGCFRGTPASRSVFSPGGQPPAGSEGPPPGGAPTP